MTVPAIMGPEPLRPRRDVKWPTPNDPGHACRACGRDVSHGAFVNVSLPDGRVVRECDDCRSDREDGPDDSYWSLGDDPGYRAEMRDAGRGSLLR